uniref:UBX domain-containing protein n=1 Tax=Mucochytrium quahogii TaxID=96639 RepID=A0A7S2W3A9_9STRA|mmetsp:Transcript_24422/g.39671  ORF Transcript_24422/g.39671 Transcript_24422/m.39671 type:complete len:513 (-) Transcript_24422:393-1931(-)|eukprot:CAMPEP_0203758486 /NCGR_PEP_ID=MMETSP0098-20131031/11313_1 /ASSEMBLY_ACC=CAM_ASM_000208 /TAXON_ID=96639 /ORGANISM=" , Strain NY0313808BC1" /LENGTH=512 /DNA_ID=CAMNT_0050650953 /DNA_START=122 /DNA_END=1660 /DNA_ORIENTATION=-
MDLDFEHAGKRLEKERIARKEKARREQLRKAKVEAKVVEQEKKIEELVEQRRKRRVEEELERLRLQELNRGIKYADALKAVPFAKAETNRVVLPHSALEILERQQVLDRVSGPLTFELCVRDDDGLVSKTFCGVDEFTAEEGTIKVPPAVALSLSKVRGVSWLENKSIDVRFVQLNRYDQVQVSFQPRGEGFHENNQQVVNIDIKSVLMRTLRDMLTLSEGDWIPLRHQGKTYELVVRKMSPEPSLLIINTDVEVELLQSETVEEEQRRLEVRQNWLEDRRKRIEGNRVIFKENSPADDILVRVRVPTGQQFTRGFARNGKLGELFAWAETLLSEDVPDQVEAGGEPMSEFYFVTMRPKKIVRIDLAGTTFEEAGLGNRVSLLLNWSTTSEDEEMEEMEEMEAEQGAFSAARTKAEEQLDMDLQDMELKKAMEASLEGTQASVTGADKVIVFQSLVANGVEPSKAAQVSQKYASQIIELETMGFTNASRNIELLDRYQGRLERVINLLAGGD